MKNLHLPHVEDLLVIEADALAPVKYLDAMFQFLMLNNPENVKVSAKWDGSPAFVCGNHPEDGRFFIGTKGVFAGKACRTKQEIDLYYGDKPALAHKLTELFWYLHPLEWKGIVQGDLLWTKDSVTYDNDGFWFQPNCLKYHFPIHRAGNIGVVCHTTYTGNDFKTMEANFGAAVPYYRMSPNVFIFEPELEMLSPNYRDLNNTHKIQKHIQWYLEYLYMIAYTLKYAPEILKSLQEPKILDYFFRYTNLQIKDPDGGVSADSFLQFIEQEYIKHITSLKTERGKRNAREDMNEVLRSIRGCDMWFLHGIFSFYQCLAEAKREIIGYLDYLFSVNHEFGWKITLPNGDPCGHEGYVLTIDNKPAKFVDRYTFSKANFELKREW